MSHLGTSTGASPKHEMTGSAAEAAAPAAGRSWLASLAPVVVFDVVGPLALYYALRYAGLATVLPLVVSGVLPAFGIALSVARHRRVDAFGGLVLFGIVVATALGLASGSAHLTLLDGTVPTAMFCLVCLGSLRSGRPLMFRFAVEAMGADTPKGRAFAAQWRYPGFRRAFRVMTVVWGLAFLAEAAAQAAVIETASVDTAKATSNVMPVGVFAAVGAWNVAYARQSRRRGERAAEAARTRGESPRAVLGQHSDRQSANATRSAVPGAAAVRNEPASAAGSRPGAPAVKRLCHLFRGHHDGRFRSSSPHIACGRSPRRRCRRS